MTTKDLVVRFDQKFGRPMTTLLGCCRRSYDQRLEHRVELLRFHRDSLIRVWRYKNFKVATQFDASIVDSLRTDGFALIKGAVDISSLLQIKSELEKHLNSGTCLVNVSKDSARSSGDFRGPTVFMSDEELSKGQGYFREHTNYASISDPFLNCPSVVQVAFAETWIDIATSYLECFPGIGGLDVRKSFVNNLPEFDTLYFHSDRNSARFLKFFFYLNDVDEEGGPFCYIRGSHRKKFKGWRSKYRWTYDEMADIYGKENILNLTANLGDVIMADTTGFHRGTKVRSKDRAMLTVHYLIHEEYGGKKARLKIRSKDYKGLSAKQKAAADFLEAVGNTTSEQQAL
jgi:hypothetical protein